MFLALANQMSGGSLLVAEPSRWRDILALVPNLDEWVRLGWARNIVLGKNSSQIVMRMIELWQRHTHDVNT